MFAIIFIFAKPVKEKLNFILINNFKIMEIIVNNKNHNF